MDVHVCTLINLVYNTYKTSQATDERGDHRLREGPSAVPPRL